jgi:transcriptional regulator with PAS, ATPase and Fis domain
MQVAMSTVPSIAMDASPTDGSPSAPFPADGPESTLMSTAQREQILRVLKQVDGNKAAAAKQLGMSRRSLYRWIERLGIPQ